MFCDDNDAVKFRMTLESYGTKGTYESPRHDIPLEDIMDGFVSLMVGASWSPTTVYRGMFEYAKGKMDLYHKPIDRKQEQE